MSVWNMPTWLSLCHSHSSWWRQLEFLTKKIMKRSLCCKSCEEERTWKDMSQCRMFTTFVPFLSRQNNHIDGPKTTHVPQLIPNSGVTNKASMIKCFWLCDIWIHAVGPMLLCSCHFQMQNLQLTTVDVAVLWITTKAFTVITNSISTLNLHFTDYSPHFGNGRIFISFVTLAMLHSLLPALC